MFAHGLTLRNGRVVPRCEFHLPVADGKGCHHERCSRSLANHGHLAVNAATLLCAQRLDEQYFRLLAFVIQQALTPADFYNLFHIRCKITILF